jgi:ankyrin repeat protein
MQINYPLDYACTSGQSERAVVEILKEYPQAASSQDPRNLQYPLHKACINSPSGIVVLTLLDTYLMAAKIKDRRGDIPYDYAVTHHHSETVIAMLDIIKSHSDNDMNNRIDIPDEICKYGLDNRRRKDIFQCLMVNSPRKQINEKYIQIGLQKLIPGIATRSERDEEGNTLLTSALMEKRPENVIFQLMDQYPYDIRTMNNDEEYPLHLACASKYSDKVVFTLLEYFPEAVKRGCIRGWYPLHLACMSMESENVVLKLLKAFPKAARIRDGYSADDSYPLDHAATSSLPDRVIAELIKVYPEAISRRDCYALHNSCMYSQSEKNILTLLDANLLAVKVRVDRDGCLPLDYARMTEKSAKLINIIELLTRKSKRDLINRVGIPDDVSKYGLVNRQRIDIAQWLSLHSPTKQVDGNYVLESLSANETKAETPPQKKIRL